MGLSSNDMVPWDEEVLCRFSFCGCIRTSTLRYETLRDMRLKLSHWRECCFHVFLLDSLFIYNKTHKNVYEKWEIHAEKLKVCLHLPFLFCDQFI